MKNFLAGAAMGAIIGMAADLFLHTETMERTAVGRAVRDMTGAVDSTVRKL